MLGPAGTRRWVFVPDGARPRVPGPVELVASYRRGASRAPLRPPARMPKPTDRELVEQAKSGDAQAFGVLVRRHQRRIFRLAFHLVRTGAEAEDVTQETFVRAYQALDRFDGRSEPFTWLYRIAVNLSLNALRARKPTRNSQPSDDPRIEALLTETRPSQGNDPPPGRTKRRPHEIMVSSRSPARQARGASPVWDASAGWPPAYALAAHTPRRFTPGHA